MDNSNQLQIPADIRTFLENLIDDAGMSTVTPKIKEEMVLDLFARLENKLIANAVEKLNPDDLEAFEGLLREGKNQQEAENFLREHIPNAPAVFAQAFLEFRDMYIGNVAAAKSTPTSAES